MIENQALTQCAVGLAFSRLCKGIESAECRGGVLGAWFKHATVWVTIAARGLATKLTQSASEGSGGPRSRFLKLRYCGESPRRGSHKSAQGNALGNPLIKPTVALKGRNISLSGIAWFRQMSRPFRRCHAPSGLAIARCTDFSTRDKIPQGVALVVTHKSEPFAAQNITAGRLVDY